ncbi:MAG: FtsX-like permease family protein, partial [Promethearchaeota archaeon]
ESIAIVSQNTLQNSDYRIFIDIDRSRLSAFSASGSLAYVNGIDQEIIKLDPQYDPVYTYRGTFWVQNYIESGIYTYSFWVQNLRISQLFRSTGIILLILMVTILAIRHNVNERKYEEGMLYSRGASQGDLDKIVNREVVVLSIFSCVLGILLGIGMSRIALGSTGFFKFDFTRMLSEPFLITLESLTIAVVVGIMIPLVSLGSYRIIYSTKRTVDEERGRLSRIVKGLNFIKWDVIVVVLSALLWMALMSGGLQNQGGGGVVPGTEILALMVPIVPLPLFLGVASLSIKVLRSGARRISRVMSFAVGQIPAAVGIRRIGKGASSGGAAAMVLVLAICLSWNSAIVDASLPVTKTYQAQLSVGADITFALDNDIIPLWDNFTQNVTSSESVTAATYVSEYTMSLSSGYGGYCTFVAVSPQEYGAIGYDYRGKRLNDSEVENMLESLESVVDGAIISEDIAQAYDFEVGDIISAAEITEEPVVYTFRVIGIVKSLPEMPGEQTYYYGYGIPTVPGFFSYGFGLVGQGRIIINREYLQSLLGSLNQTSNYLCVSTSRDANGTAIGQSVLEAGGYEVLYNNIWDSVSSQRDEYLKDASYHIDRSVDTMMTVLTVGTIMGAFAIYAVEGVRARKREIALLRASGANNGLIVKAQGAEMLVLMIFSFVVLAGYSPLFLTTSIASAGSSFVSYYEIYPIALFPVIPWLTIFTVLAFFVVSVVVFIGIVAILGSRINLAETLNASWAEASPYGDDV